MTLSFLYARSGKIRNRILNVNKLFLKRFVNVNEITRIFYDIELSIRTIRTSSKSNMSSKRTIIFTKVC